MGADNLSSLLWHERELLDMLTFKLVEEQLLLKAGASKWLHHASLEVAQVVKKLAQAGLARTVATSAVAIEWGVAEDATLAQLAAAAPEPWDDLLRSHLDAMSGQTAAIKQLRDDNEQFLRAAARSAQETVAALMPEAGTYDAHGAAAYAVPAGRGRIFDKEL